MRTRRAVDINHRKRRNSHRGYPDLHQTHSIEKAAALPVVRYFDDRTRPVTFKLRIGRTSDAANGPAVSLGNEGAIGFAGGALQIVTGGGTPDTFIGAFVGAPVLSAEVVVAFLPDTGLVRAWVDSDLVISGRVTTYPYSWATSGNLTYSDPTGALTKSRLGVFLGQLPRHFNLEDVPVAPVAEDLLLRAARATYKLGHWPFMDNPNI